MATSCDHWVVVNEKSLTAAIGISASPYPVTAGSTLDAGQTAAIIDRYRAAPGVFLHHAGHTHRNHRSELAGAPGVVHQEVAAVKESYTGRFLADLLPRPALRRASR